jgi:Flp pilus assembly protein TadB
MAQTRRKTKHRGNAAGVVESRGRTGRKPTAAEKSGDQQALAREREKRIDRRDRRPTWKSAFWRSLVAAMVLVLVLGVLLHASPGESVAAFFVALAAYTPFSYYTDQWMYDRRMRKKAAEGDGGRAASR